MPVVNATVAMIFEEIAELLDVQGANPFRIRAYRNAARTVSELGTDIKTLMASGTDLTEIPGVGKDLAGKILEIVNTGKCQVLEGLRKEVPLAVTELLRIPGLGPKRVKILWRDLNIQTLDQLLRAAKDGRIHELPGFGEKTEQRILEAALAHLGESRRFKLSVAAQYGEHLVEHLRKASGVKRIEITGSYRRMKETVGDLDIVIAASAYTSVMEHLTHYEEVKDIISKGTTRATVILKSGIQVDVRVVPEKSYGSALLYFTGSKLHNIAIRRIAQDKGLKINEYGVFKGRRHIAGETEESVYEAIGLSWIPPELREDRGEIEAASAGKLPILVERSDLKGDLHAHSKASDGRNTIEEMALAAKACGLRYMAITDHSKRLTVARGLDSVRLVKQIAEVERINKTLSGITILAGIEVDILDDGTLDLPDSVLVKLDIVVAAVHSKFDLPRARQTERILKALDNPFVSILAHPTGRLIDEREPYDVDMQRVIRKTKACGVALEVNAHPQRLDLLDIYCQMAKEEGARVAINSDAHNTFELDGLRFGVGQARRGWLEKQDVLNTRSLKELRVLLRRTSKQALVGMLSS
ncbi:MAG: DNA polymerase/3'-5' exonuclease PolX [Gammaproteobacteria bacterium]